MHRLAIGLENQRLLDSRLAASGFKRRVEPSIELVRRRNRRFRSEEPDSRYHEKPLFFIHMPSSFPRLIPS